MAYSKHLAAMIAPAFLFCILVASVQSSLSAKCNGDGTITITVPYDRVATLSKISYGNCNATSDGISTTQDSGDNTIYITLNIKKCDMASNLRTLSYGHNATFWIGSDPRDSGPLLLFDTYAIDVTCSYITSYTINFNYGLEMPVDSLNGSNTLNGAGSTNITDSTTAILEQMEWKVEIYTNSSYCCIADEQPDIAGEFIYFGIKSTIEDYEKFNLTEDFSLADFGLDLSFAATSCSVKDTEKSITLELFDTDSGVCNNEAVDLEVGYTNGMITIVHRLFLLDSMTSSDMDLECTIRICDENVMANACDTSQMACG